MIYTKYDTPVYSFEDLLKEAENTANYLALAIAARVKEEIDDSHESIRQEGYADGYDEGYSAGYFEGKED